jgi:hypothetical protein
MKPPTPAWEAKLRKALVAREKKERELAAAHVAGLTDRGRMRLANRLVRSGEMPVEAYLQFMARSNSPKRA